MILSRLRSYVDHRCNLSAVADHSFVLFNFLALPLNSLLYFTTAMSKENSSQTERNQASKNQASDIALYCMRKPFSIRLAARHHIVNKSHAPDTIFNRRKIQCFFRRYCSINFSRQGLGKISIDISKSFQVTFRVATGCAAAIFCKAAECSIISARP